MQTTCSALQKCANHRFGRRLASQTGKIPANRCGGVLLTHAEIVCRECSDSVCPPRPLNKGRGKEPPIAVSPCLKLQIRRC
jgi:hypothetical protein